MVHLVYLGILAVICILFVWRYKRQAKRARDDIASREQTLQQQDVQYQKWKGKYVEKASECTAMQERIFELIAKLVTEDIREPLEYGGVSYEGNTVILHFITPQENYSTALMQRSYIREQLAELKEQWDEPWLAPLDLEILSQITERGAEHEYGFAKTASITV